MKKTFTLSISGRIFQVEEDAYALLLDYLDNLAQVFKGQDGDEIVNDIEARISDLFQEQADAGKIVFTLADAEQVINIIGNADELASSDTEDTTDTNSRQQSENQDENTPPCPPPPYYTPVSKKLYRSYTDKVLGGVLGGMSIHFGISVLPLRLIVVMLALALGFLPLFAAYCIAWALIPPANTPERILEQEGRPVTVANIGEVLRIQASRPKNEEGGTTFLNLIGTLIMGFIGLVSAAIGIAMLVGFFTLIVVYIAAICQSPLSDYWINMPDIDPGIKQIAYLVGAALCLAVLLPCISVVWAACSVIFKVKGASKSVWITGIVIEIIALLFLCIAFPVLIS